MIHEPKQRAPLPSSRAVAWDLIVVVMVSPAQIRRILVVYEMMALYGCGSSG
jgi:hypothetical protein